MKRSSTKPKGATSYKETDLTAMQAADAGDYAQLENLMSHALTEALTPR